MEDYDSTTEYESGECENDVDIEETETSGDGLSQIIKFKAKISDSGCHVICQILQLDDRQNEVTLPSIIRLTQSTKLVHQDFIARCRAQSLTHCRVVGGTELYAKACKKLCTSTLSCIENSQIGANPIVLHRAWCTAD